MNRMLLTVLILTFSIVLTFKCEDDTGIGKTGFITYSLRGEAGSESFTTKKGFDIQIHRAFMVAGAFQAFFGIEGQAYNLRGDLLASPSNILFHTGHPHTLEGCPTAGESRVCDVFVLDLLAEKNILKKNVASRAGLYTAFLYFVLNYNPDLVKTPEEVLQPASGDIPQEIKDGAFVYLDFSVNGENRQLSYSIELITHVDEQVTEFPLNDGEYREVIYEISLKRWFESIEDYSNNEEVIHILRSKVYDWYSWSICTE
jgi:hypothetical protein